MPTSLLTQSSSICAPKRAAASRFEKLARKDDEVMLASKVEISRILIWKSDDSRRARDTLTARYLIRALRNLSPLVFHKFEGKSESFKFNAIPFGLLFAKPIDWAVNFRRGRSNCAIYSRWISRLKDADRRTFSRSAARAVGALRHVLRPASKVEAAGRFPRYISRAHAGATRPMNYRDTKRCRN